MTPNTESAAIAAPMTKKPRLSFLLATSFGLGYLPKAPGTFGSIFGVVLSIGVTWVGALRVLALHGATDGPDSFWRATWGASYVALLGTTIIAVLGVYVSTQVANYAGKEDPQFVVIDEVSGQLLTYYILPFTILNWKTWLLGFILFRLFDIWKPYPIRLLEKLPGGWGIMADDWLAGIYAAIVLRLAVHLFHL
jgi:phosphatidylglycerophosphatase A